MPAPARTSLPDIVAAAAELLETGGLDALTMLGVAERVGVRGPSLYKHVADRSSLIRMVAIDAAHALAAELRDVPVEADAPSALVGRARVRRMADAVRAFAHRRPEAFALVFRPPAEEWRVPDDDLARSAAPVLAAAAALAGPDHALEAARTLTALTWGFVSMELAGAFRLGGDVEAAWAFAMGALVDGLAGVSGAPRP